MDKFKVILVALLTFVLVACGSGEVEGDSNEEANEMDDQTIIAEVNEVVADDELVTIKITNVEYVPEDEVGNYPYYSIGIEVENNTDDEVGVSTGKQSIDNEMATDLFYFVETITGGKKLSDWIEINAYGEELPEIKESIEFNIDIDKDMELIESYEVKINIE